MNCKVQRKDCRDRNNDRQRKLVDVVKTDKDDGDVELPPQDVPKVFGDLVTSDSIFDINRNSNSTARHGDIAFVVRDRGTGWLAAYPSKKKSAEDIKGAVNDSLGPEKAERWYPDGAPELHAVLPGTRYPARHFGPTPL